MDDRIYIAIDLKSFFASVECIERGLDPLGVNLVVADPDRTEKTICLAVSPSLKAYGISGRARLFEVVQRVNEVNALRRSKAPHHRLTGSSYIAKELAEDPSLALDYIVAPPKMAHYMDFSTRIYKMYLKYVAPEDIHVYSIDEVFIDTTSYIKTLKLSPHDFAMRMILDVLKQTGITATAGIGTNLYLAKIALDIEAKHITPDENGVRIAQMDEMSYRRSLWSHRPLTDFWRIGRGYAKKLEEHGLYTMGDVARCSLGKATEHLNEELLYKLFGVNAELLIDHAWGWEPCTMAQIKAYKPSTNSISSGQVLQCPYEHDKTRLIIREMADMLALELLDKELVTDQLVLTIGYDTDNLKDSNRKKEYHGEITIDRYGREVPKHAHGTINLGCHTSSGKIIMDSASLLYDKIINKGLLIRRLNITANHVIYESDIPNEPAAEQLELFTDYEAKMREKAEKAEQLEQERKAQKAVISIKKKFGKNAVLRGMNLEEGATAKDRNGRIGGHRA